MGPRATHVWPRRARLLLLLLWLLLWLLWGLHRLVGSTCRRGMLRSSSRSRAVVTGDWCRGNGRAGAPGWARRSRRAYSPPDYSLLLLLLLLWLVLQTGLLLLLLKAADSSRFSTA